MWFRSGTEAARAALATVTVLTVLAATLLAGCSDIYYDRRDTVALGADDHIAVNRVAQMIDPWPRDVGKRQIAFEGQKMQAAVERYRTERVIPPVNVTTSSAAYQQAEQAAATTLNTVNPTQLSAPAAPVK
jgi:hypothetical protein